VRGASSRIGDAVVVCSFGWWRRTTIGFIEYNGELPLKINSSLRIVVLHD
jgi:hypothetical protein